MNEPQYSEHFDSVEDERVFFEQVEMITNLPSEEIYHETT